MARRGIFIFIIFLVLGALVILGIRNKSPNKPLSEIEKAVISGNIEKVRLMLKENPTLVNQQGRLNRTPLYWASLAVIGDDPERTEELEMVEFLVQNGADVNAKDNYGYTPLMNAATSGNKKVVEFLISNKADINSKANPVLDRIIKDDGIWFRRAELKGQYKDSDPGNYMSKIISCGTALHNAAYQGNLEIVKILIDAGADVNLKNESNYTALYPAVEENHTKIIEELISDGANLDSGLLASVIKRKDVKLTMKFLADGANPDARDVYNMTLLSKVVSLDPNEEIANMLIDYGSDVNIRNDGNCTALHYACHAVNVDIVQRLIQKGALANVKDISGRTPLHRTVDGSGKMYPDSDRKKIAELLISNGMNVNEQDKNGDTALHIAVENGLKETIELLVTNGADVDIKNKQKKTPLHIADEKAQIKNRRLASVYREIFFLLLNHSKMPESQAKKFKCVKQIK